MRGRELFLGFLERRGITRFQAAVALGVQPSTVHYWLTKVRPNVGHRGKIATWSEGEIPADSWLTAEEVESMSNQPTAPRLAGDGAPPESRDSTPERDLASGEE